MPKRRGKSGTVKTRGNERGPREIHPGAMERITEGAGAFLRFYDLHAAVAEVETRTLTVPRSSGGVPAGEYGFVEAFCAGPECDCRRVMFFVMRRGDEREAPRHAATIGFGWESLAFYRTWLKGDVECARDMKGPCIEPNSPRCSYDRALLDLFFETSLSDPRYVERVARHYTMFKQTLSRRPGG